eukprot:s2569_g4.t1
MELARLRSALGEGQVEVEIDKLRALLGAVEADVRLLRQVKDEEGGLQECTDGEFILRSPEHRKKMLTQAVKTASSTPQAQNTLKPAATPGALAASPSRASPSRASPPSGAPPGAVPQGLRSVQSATELRKTPLLRPLTGAPRGSLDRGSAASASSPQLPGVRVPAKQPLQPLPIQGLGPGAKSVDQQRPPSAGHWADWASPSSERMERSAPPRRCERCGQPLPDHALRACEAGSERRPRQSSGSSSSDLDVASGEPEKNSEVSQLLSRLEAAGIGPWQIAELKASEAKLAELAKKHPGDGDFCDASLKLCKNGNETRPETTIKPIIANNLRNKMRYLGMSQTLRRETPNMEQHALWARFSQFQLDSFQSVINSAQTVMAEEKEQSAGEFALFVTLKILGVLLSLYLFLFGLDLMGGSFSALGSKGAGNLFTFSNNPIAGLMVGVLATVLVQSSSTSTSIVVGLVGADVLKVTQAIPIIMGANIGTSVTNTIVSMAHAGNRLELERAFSGATVHDCFNMISVLTLLPLEIIIAAITGEGGLLYFISKGLTDAIIGGGGESDLRFPSPTKEIVSPFTKLFLSKDKNTIKALSFGAPEAQSCGADCTKYCVSKDVSKAWKKVGKKVAEDAYETFLVACSGTVTCDSGSCYTNAGEFFDENIKTGRTIKGGFLKDAGDVAGGIIGLILSLLVLCGALIVMVKLLHSLVMGQAKKAIMKGTQMNDYLAILVGLGITIIVQSSSVTTSALTPLVGIGVLPVHKMLPMTLGANIGTTFTALFAALAVMKYGSLQIAFCHLLFNLTGIFIWFPIPMMRRVVLTAACTLGFYASYWRLVPLIYILVMFVAVPGICLLISLLYTASVAGGVIVTLLFLAAVAGLIFWWVKLGGCYKVVSLEEREARKADLLVGQVGRLLQSGEP